VIAPWHPDAALSGAGYSAVELDRGATRVWLLDQRLLPTEERYLTLAAAPEVARAITEMAVRGAPAIGIAAAYGMVLASRAGEHLGVEPYRTAMSDAADLLRTARPTAVNLAWAVDRCLRVALENASAPGAARWGLLADLARDIHRADVSACRAMGRIGAARLPRQGTVLTHCNAGALATGGYGTALGVVRAAIEGGARLRVLADETRPWWQGARLTAWELQRDGIEVEVICDSMAASFMRRGDVAAVVVGADRIADNGDVANKIGTYGLACLARAHGVPFYVAAPWSTVDRATARGDDIVIEERGRAEMAYAGDRMLVPDGVPVRNPAFDVTPAALVDAIFTERGELRPAEGICPGTLDSARPRS
jgi:methylthioribose-1-phosphate isomerase